MVKFFLKDTDQEVKVGDVIDISIPMKTPFGMGVTNISKVEVTQASLATLIEKGVVVKREDELTNNPVYIGIIRRLAGKNEVEYTDMVNLLQIVKSISPKAYALIMLEAIIDAVSQGKTTTTQGYFINLYDGDFHFSKTGENEPFPGLYSIKEAKRVRSLYLPIING